MNVHDGSRRHWISLVGLAAVLSAGLLAVLFGSRLYRTWRQGDSPSSGGIDGRAAVQAVLPEAESQQIRDLVKVMMNPDRSGEAAAQLRQHIDTQVQQKAATAPLAMAFIIECLEPKFASLDTEARRISLLFLADILGWFRQNSTNCWVALLGPSKAVLGSALRDPSSEVTQTALQILRDCWVWSPPDVEAPAQRKALGTWKSELHERCVELLGSRDQQIRAAAGVAVVSVPIDMAAAKGLVLLQDDSPEVRRTVLLALSDRPEVLSNDDVLPLLNDSSKRVRNTADLVLSSRGLSREQISLAARATNPATGVRAQVPRYVVESSAVDRSVWLTHLSRDEAAEVRTEAARALAAVGDEECLARLTEMAQSDPDPQVQKLAGDLIQQSP
ncbi:MAG: HEAT repeat domain-containing protein, partial [Planctomycetes bacterium]|nr:HEAT repeat domain-containing protein [Planctomycetota bacterium]